MTNDEVSTNIVPSVLAPRLSKGEGAPLPWSIRCGGVAVNGTLPWRGVQTVVLPCDE